LEVDVLAPQITFHGLAHSRELEADILERIAWIEKFYEGITDPRWCKAQTTPDGARCQKKKRRPCENVSRSANCSAPIAQIPITCCPVSRSNIAEAQLKRSRSSMGVSR
jgi:hypothetical protein